MTVVILAPQYKMTLPAVRDLAGCRVVLAGEKGGGRLPIGAASRYADGYIETDGPQALIELLEAQSERPVLLPFSAGSQQMVSENRQRLSLCADFLLAPDEAISAANDKAFVTRLAGTLGIPVPRSYTRETAVFPCVVKPVCGEKYGLTAAARYRIVRTQSQLDAALAAFGDCGPVLIQEYVEGDAVGVSVLMGEEKRPLSFLCHKRLRQRPVSGGPSTACVSIYDRALLEHAVNLLSALSFRGPAMVEFKGGRLLEVNPRVWGSYALTRAAGSDFTAQWAGFKTAAYCRLDVPAYRVGVKMRFALADLATIPGYIRQGEYKNALKALNPFVRDGIFEWRDPKPGLAYLKRILR